MSVSAFATTHQTPANTTSPQNIYHSGGGDIKNYQKFRENCKQKQISAPYGASTIATPPRPTPNQAAKYVIRNLIAKPHM